MILNSNMMNHQHIEVLYCNYMIVGITDNHSFADGGSS